MLNTLGECKQTHSYASEQLPMETVTASDSDRRPPGGGHGSPLQAPSLENLMHRGNWQPAVHEAATECDTA